MQYYFLKSESVSTKDRLGVCKYDWIYIAQLSCHLEVPLGANVLSYCCALVAPYTVRSLARGPRVLIGWPLSLDFGLDGRLLLARRGGFMFNSSSSLLRAG